MTSDDDLRHDHEFVNDTEAVIRLGSMLLSSGTGSYRVKRAMTDTGDALGMDRLDATVGLTEITVTAHRGDNFRTVAREVYRVRVDSSRISALEELAHNLPEGMTGRDVEARLDNISRTVRPQWKEWQTILAGGFACAGFAILAGSTSSVSRRSHLQRPVSSTWWSPTSSRTLGFTRSTAPDTWPLCSSWYLVFR